MLDFQKIISYNLGDDVSIYHLDILYGYKLIRPEWAVIVPDIYIPSAPAIIGVKEALIMGATAAIIKNPVISRRFWAGWTK